MSLFGSKRNQARRRYRAFVQQNIEQGRRPKLVGGGLIPSLGGWTQTKTILKGSGRFKGHERVFGDSDFVAYVLASNNEQLERRYWLAAKGIDIQALAHYAWFGIRFKGLIIWNELVNIRHVLYASAGRHP